MRNWFTGAASPEPPAPGAVIREVAEDGIRVRLDLTPQILTLEIPRVEFSWRGRPDDLAAVCPDTAFVSASMLAVRAKLFDDGLYAAAEAASQPAKQALLAALANLSPTVTAAARLGGLDVTTTPAADARAADFLADEQKSKPLGFYTWSDGLGRIFQQDRMLQEELAPKEAGALAAALGRDPALADAYARHLDFVAKLTNALSASKPDLRRPGGNYFFPPSRSHEKDLAGRLVGPNRVPTGFSLARELVKALRAGAIDLAPTPSSGWYDIQTWALEPLVLLERMPEGSRLRVNAAYQQQLDELFQAVLSLTRETHVKQLDLPELGAARWGIPLRLPEPFWIQPGLTVEPVRSYYERRARTYEFVRALLEADRRLDGMHRLTATGPVRESLADELDGMTALFRSAAAVAGHELGMEAAPSDAEEPLRRFAGAPGTAEDIRMMVPVFYDLGRHRMKVWAILGWSTRSVTVGFAVPPAATVLKGHRRIRFVPESHQLAYPVFAEAYVERLLDRAEFRAHCDRYRTAERILGNL